MERRISKTSSLLLGSSMLVGSSKIMARGLVGKY